MNKKQPWECPRCRSWNSPDSAKCDCKPIIRDFCTECLLDAYSLFKPPYPSLDIIHAYAEDFHKNFAHRNNTYKPTTINIEKKLIPVKCAKCKTEFLVHPLQNMNTGYVTDCELHKKKIDE